MTVLAYLAIASSLVTLAQAGKRGLAFPWFNNGVLSPAAFQQSSSVDYMYTWETWAPASKGDLNFIGMQGCYPSCSSSPVDQLATRAAQQGWTDVFSANEPDLAGYSPTDVANWYRQWVEPLRIRKGYPAVTSSTASNQGLNWLASFMNACQGCYHDYINLHWYGTSLGEFQNFITNAHNRFPGEKIVISEFALTGASQAAQIAFYQGAQPWLDNLSYVVMYFPFVATSPSLLRANDAGAASYVGTGSCLYNDDKSRSAVGNVVAA